VSCVRFAGRGREAKDLLPDGVDEGSIGGLCREFAVDESPDFSVKPPLVTSLAAARQFFWRRATHSRIDVDWPSHGASRVGPIFRDPTPMARGGAATLKASWFASTTAMS